jgi:hypothetical protein
MSQQIKSSLDSYYWRVFVLTSFALILIGITLFAHKTSAVGSDISKAYVGDNTIVAGSIVSLDSKRPGFIILANKNSSNQPIGVAVKNNSSLLAIDSSDTKIQVSINGSAHTLVSTVNGDIDNGDYIAQSEISGVGAKAKPGDKTIGIAQTTFNSASQNASIQKIKDASGKEKEVNIGGIPVLVSPGAIPKTSQDGTSAIEDWAGRLAGRRVSLLRIVVSGVVAVVAITSIIILIYSSIRNSIIAVSRNPLAKPMIFEALAQILFMVMLVSVISITIMYLIIRL